MVETVTVAADGRAAVTILLTVSGCPLKETLTRDTTAALMTVDGVTARRRDPRGDERRAAHHLREKLRGGVASARSRSPRPARSPASTPSRPARVAWASPRSPSTWRHRWPSRGCGSGSSTPTSTASRSPACSASSGRPTQVDDMILPPLAHDVKVISIGMFVPGNQPVVWRGPMLHRALQQFLGRRLLGRPRRAPARPAAGHRRHRDLGGPAHPRRRDPRRHHPAAGRRRGGRAGGVHRAADPPADRRASSRTCPGSSCPTASRQEIFGCGGGQSVADSLTRAVGRRVPLLGQIPLDTRLREGADQGMPVVLGEPDSPGRRRAARRSPEGLGPRARGLAGRSLGPHPRRPLSAAEPRDRLAEATARLGPCRRVPAAGRPAGRAQVASASSGVGRDGSWLVVAGCPSTSPSLARARRRAAPPGRSGAGRTGAGRLLPVDVVELRAHLLAQLRRGALGHARSLADQPGQLGGVLGQPLGPEHEHGDHGQEHELPAVDVQRPRSTPLHQPVRRSVGRRLQGHPDSPLRAAATDGQRDGVADRPGPDGHDELVGVGDRACRRTR